MTPASNELTMAGAVSVVEPDFPERFPGQTVDSVSGDLLRKDGSRKTDHTLKPKESFKTKRMISSSIMDMWFLA